MGDSKGGSADSSGMAEAMASAEAADKAYALGEQQFQWSQQVWNQEQPLIDASEQAQINLATQETASLTQSQDESQQEWQEYLNTYQPLEQQYTQQAESWDSPQAIAEARGQAMADVGEQGMAGVNTAAETLRSYGVNPASPKYAGLYTSAQPMIGAAEAAAGTTAAQNLRLQQMGLESGAINTGRGLVNSTGQLTQAGTGAGSAASGSASGAGNTAFGNLSGTAVGAGATSQLFNAGTGAMNAYVGAVNGYNDSNAAFAQANATEMAGIGSAIGGIAGLGMGHFMHAKGGPIQKFAYGGPAMGYDDGGAVDPNAAAHGIPAPTPGPTVTYPSGQSQQIMMGQPRYAPVTAAVRQQQGMPLIDSRTQGRGVFNDPRAAPMADPRTFKRYDGGGPTDPQLTPDQGGGATGIPSAPMPPAQQPPGPPMPTDATPGGGVPAYASPSNGQATDDVPALLTANEFVIPKDVATWKGHEYFAKQIDAARRGQQQFAQRDDIGGEPAPGIPQQPTFVSRPMHMGTTRGAIPGLA